MFHTPIQARQFFEDRIIQQADVEGAPLSADECLMLKWSESEPDSIGDLALAERLAGEISDDDYQEKIAGLLTRSYAADVAREPRTKEAWADAFRAVQRADYYIGIMIDRALARQLTPWWKFRQ
jgi:hypothetical protein